MKDAVTVTLLSAASEEGNGQINTWEVSTPSYLLGLPKSDCVYTSEPGMIIVWPPMPIIIPSKVYVVKG